MTVCERRTISMHFRVSPPFLSDPKHQARQQVLIDDAFQTKSLVRKNVSGPVSETFQGRQQLVAGDIESSGHLETS